jgi:hypothetical protein
MKHVLLHPSSFVIHPLSSVPASVLRETQDQSIAITNDELTLLVNARLGALDDLSASGAQFSGQLGTMCPRDESARHVYRSSKAPSPCRENKLRQAGRRQSLLRGAPWLT